MIISIINNKGGVLKTTIATNLGASLAIDKKRTIVVDLDGQGNVAATFGKNPFILKNTIMDVLNGKANLNETIICEMSPYLYILPSNDELNYFDLYISQGVLKIDLLKKIIRDLNDNYNYVIVDTPPIMSSVVSCMLSISDVVIIPFEPDQYAVLGLKRIINAALSFIQKTNHNLKIIAVPTKVNMRANIHREIIEISLRPKLTSQGIYVTKNYISASTKSTSSVGYERVPIILSAQKNKYQDEYYNLKNEILWYANKQGGLK